ATSGRAARPCAPKATAPIASRVTFPRRRMRAASCAASRPMPGSCRRAERRPIDPHRGHARMDIRKLPAGQALAWFKQAIDLGGSNPRGVFGAAILMIAAFYVVVLALMLPMMGLPAGLQSEEVDMAAVMTRVMPM